MGLRIFVCVKVVPRTAVAMHFDRATFRLDRSGATEINPPDLHAVEEALRIRDYVGGEVAVLTMAPEAGRESLRTALAMGVDRAIVLSDAAMAGSDLVATSRVIAAALNSEQYDIVIFGAQSMDSGGAQLWAAVAERMRLPVLSGVRSVEILGHTIRATRQTAVAEVVMQATTPCVIGLSGAANVPRYPTFPNIVAAKKKRIDVRSLADLGLDIGTVGQAGARTTVLSINASPPRRGAADVVRDEGNGAAWLADFIISRGLV